MHWISLGLALLAALAIIAIGVMYVLRPKAMTPSFGLPLPEEGRNIVWWLRLKGVRDIVLGLIVLAVMAWGDRRVVGIVVLVAAITPLGDMSLVLSAKGSTRTALSVHGVTAAVMVLAAIPLILGLS